MNKLHFLSFAAGSANFDKALKRISAQAIKTNIFDEVTVLDKNWLINQKDFWSKHSQFINKDSNKKGWGFMLWKPYVINEYFKKLNDGDVLVWCDAGCEIYCNLNSVNFKKALIHEVNTCGFLATEGNPALHYKQYTKGDVYKFFNSSVDKMLNNNYVYFETNRLFFTKNKLNTKIIEDWYEVMSNNYSLFDHSPSVTQNPPEFSQSRHDQMIFNFILYKYKELNHTHVLHHLISPIFRAYRSRNGISRLCEKFNNCVCDCCTE